MAKPPIPQLTAKDQKLRELASARLESLRKREDKLRKHLESDRGARDWQSLRYLLHQVEVERNDLFHNLKDPAYVPKPGKAKRERSRPVVKEPTKPEPKEGPAPVKGSTRHPIQRPVPGIGLPKFKNKNDNPEDKQDTDQDGRSWCAAPFVEVRLPYDPQIRANVIGALRKYRIADEREIVRQWASATFGSVEDAKPALLAGAQLNDDVSAWRGWLAQSANADDYARWSDAEVREAMQSDAKGDSLRARRTVLALASKSWVKQTVDAIKASAPEGVDKDTLDRRLRSGLKGFFTAANGGKHTNPQFPYLTDEKPLVPMEDVVAGVLDFLDDKDEDRYVKDKEDDRKRHRVTILQKELGKARPRQRLELQTPKWQGLPTVSGTITKRRDASLVWDTSREEDGLALAIPMGGFSPIATERFVYQDGMPLAHDGQLLTKKGAGKGCAVLPLLPKHAFRRWYNKHVENHNPEAPMERRCLHNTTQFVIVDPDGPNPRLFIRPVFKFYEPQKTVPNTHEAWKKPDCRYLVGIDRGINYVLRAVVVDTERMEVVADIALPGRKHEWKLIRDEIAYWQQMRDLARNQGASPSVVRRHSEALARARRKDRGLGQTETVEAVAKLVQRCVSDYGDGNFCFVLEKLDLGRMNLKRNNRVKHLATVEDALVNQMRKLGYAYNDKRHRHGKEGKKGVVDGVRFEGAWYTSQISPSGWWAKTDEIEEAWKKDDTRPIGRRVGQYYEMPKADEDGNRADTYRRGEWKKPRNEGGKAYGRNRFCVEPGDEDPTNERRSAWGSELIWDPTCSSFKGREFPEGVVLDADFVGALNIALRPLVNDGQGKGFNTARMAEAHTKLNPQVKLVCEVPAYEFVERDGDPRGALRRVMV